MGFYTKLSGDLRQFDNYLLRANAGDLEIIRTYGYEKTKFLMAAIQELTSRKNLSKIIEGCIEYQLWGFLTFLLTQYASYNGVQKAIMKNYQKIPAEYCAQIISVLCYCQKWSDHELNNLFLEITDPKIESNGVNNIEEDVLEVYYALGWNESYQAALNNPCWFDSEIEAAAYCFYSKIYFSKNSHIPELIENSSDFYMFGENELNNIYTVKTRVLKAKVKKADVLAVIDTQELSDDFFPQINIIQNRAVYDIEELDPFEVKETELDHLAMFASIDDENMDNDEFDNKLDEIYEILIKNCERVGVPELITANKVQNKEMVSPKDVAMLIRTRLRVTQGNALKVAKEICKREKNARWVYSGSQGYRSKKGYFYRGLCYSAYTNKVFPIPFQYVKDDFIKVIYNQEIQEDCKDFTDVFAVDYQTESKTLDGCLEKCREIADPTKKKGTTTEIKTVKETLSEEEKEAIKRQYREEVDIEYRKEIQIHKDSADSKANELEILKIKYEKLLRENEDLKKQLDKKQSILDKQNDVSVLSMGIEKEKYDGETHAMVLSAIRHELKNCERDTRRHDVLESVLEKNMEDNDPISEKLTEIKKITKGYRIASEMKPSLIKQGFQYTEDGRHPKIQYPDDDRYIITAASTTSDTRAGENLYALIKKKFF